MRDTWLATQIASATGRARNQRLRLTICICSIAILFATSTSLCAQSRSRQKTPASKSAITLTLHSVTVDSEGRRTISPALKLFDPQTAFQTGEHLLLRYEANFDSFVYIVNVSPDTTSLQYPASIRDNSVIPARTVREFQFLFTGESGKEDLIIAVSRSMIGIATLKDGNNDSAAKLTQSRPRYSSQVQSAATGAKNSPSFAGISIENYSAAEFIALARKYLDFGKRPLTPQQFSMVHVERKDTSFLISKDEPRNSPNNLVSLRLSINHVEAINKVSPSRRETPVSRSGGPSSKRTALVIGNARYQAMGSWFATDLREAVHNDADSIASALRQIGFEVTLEYDLTQSDMLRSVRRLADDSGEDGTLLVYYSGIGREFENKSYLFPVDASPPDRPGFENSLVELQSIIDMLNRTSTPEKRTNIFLLDAGPLGEVEVPRSTIIGFASEAHRNLNALKFRQRNSIYTEALLRYLKEPGLKVDDFFSRVREYVNSRTQSDENGPQIPRASYSQNSFLLHP